MRTSFEKQDDGKILVTFNHKDVIDTRVMDPVLTENGEINEEVTGVRIAEVAAGIEVKIDMGIITNDTIAMMRAAPPSIPHPIREVERKLAKPKK